MRNKATVSKDLSTGRMSSRGKPILRPESTLRGAGKEHGGTRACRRKCGADLAAPRDRAGTGAGDLRPGSDFVSGRLRARDTRRGTGESWLEGSIERAGAYRRGGGAARRDLRRKRDESGGEWGWRAAVEKRDGEGRGERG
jgi:hypothetical protein